MMTSLQNKKECGKEPKKTFGPPAKKLRSVTPAGPGSPEENLGISSLEAEDKPSLPKDRLEKKQQKTATRNGLSRGQGKKGKAQKYKPTEKKVKEKSVLTDEEFEEIVQIVLHKPFKECFDMVCEAYSAQSIVCTQSDKEPGIATSATDNDNTDGESVMVSHATEISASVEDEVIPAIRTCKRGQVVRAPSEKKLGRLPLSKRKKEARPCLIWVQCSSLNCEKWRRLRGNIDPSVLPDDWSCDQNTDLDYNRCDIPEETWTEYESDVVYASYVPGSIIWAKQYGYPWWPGMVESDPDLGEYFFFNSPLDSVPSKYHVTFFGETVSRAWVPVSMLKNFQELSLELTGVKKCKNKEHIQKLGAAIKMAQKAKQTSFQERVNLFGFWSRYSGSDSNGEGKDLMVSVAKGLDPYMEKEKEAEMEEVNKEEKQDPVPPGPKPANILTKKPKAKGLAGKQGRTLRRKIMKKSLERESKMSSVPTMGGKEGQRSSDPDQPGLKKKFQVPQRKASAISLSEKKEIRMVPESPAQPAYWRACPLAGEEGLGPQDPLIQEVASVSLEDEASSDLGLEQLMEDIGIESEEHDPQDSVEARPLPPSVKNSQVLLPSSCSLLFSLEQ